MNDESDRAPHVIPLARAGRGNFVRRRGRLVEALWILVETTLIDNRLNPSSAVRVFLLRLFGARIGRGCVCPHAFRVKFPWNLTIGDDCWIGDGVWIYNQGPIRIGSDVCISQRSFLTTGSHDWQTDMSLRIDPIVIEDGAWITSMCVVQKGVTIGAGTVVTPLSVVHRSLPPGWICGGNPAVTIRPRFTPASCERRRAEPRPPGSAPSGTGRS